MADESGGFRGRKKKLPSMSELIAKGEEFLGIPKQKQKRRKVHYEFSTDPVTGLRNNKGTYNERYQKRQMEMRKLVSAENSSTFDIDSINNSFEDSCYSSTQISTMTGEMKDTLLEAKELMLKWQGGVLPKKQKWTERQSVLNDSWVESRSTIFKTLLKSSFAFAEDRKCSRCTEQVAVVRCHECPQTKQLCSVCDDIVHQLWPFHDRDALMNGHYSPIPPTTSKGSNGEWVIVGRSLPPLEIFCAMCNGKCAPLETLPESQCIAVTQKGRFDINHRQYLCLGCNKVLSTSEPAVIIQLGFWPGSISDMTYIFDQNLFIYWDITQKQIPGISERSFLKSLGLFSKCKGRVATINATTFGSSFKEWKYSQFELDKLRFTNWMECPACGVCQHSVHVDGNMKLYRFKSAGMRKRDSYYGETFVVSNEKVDRHIHKVYQGAKQRRSEEQAKCGDTNWRAAGNTLQKKKNLSETGLEIAGCRHGLAQHAVNMIYGEVYGYAHYLQINYFIPKQVQFFWYDVVCKYWPWLKKHDKASSEKMKPALSVMHSKAHNWSCQALWGGRWQNGAAATTGEEVEQINSHFSRLGSSTKHMLPEGREELLTEHAMHWNRRKIEALPRSLAKRYTKVQNQVKQLRQELREQFESLGLNESEICLEDWREDVLVVAKEEEASHNQKARLTSEEELYLCHLLTLQECTCKQKLLCEIAADVYGRKVSDLQAKSCENYAVGEAILEKKAMSFLQKQVERLHHSISQLAFNMGKLADGSKQRQRIRTKISSEKASLERKVALYNQLAVDQQVQLQEMENGNFPWNAGLWNKDAVPVRTKRLVVDKYMEALRFQEEIELLQKEMMGFMKFYRNTVLLSLGKQQGKLQCMLKDKDLDTEGPLEDDSPSLEYTTASTEKRILMAKLALVMDGTEFAMNQIAAGINAFATVLTDELDAFRQVLLTHEVGNDEDGEDDADDVSLADEEELEQDNDELHGSDISMTTRQGNKSSNIVLDALYNLGAALENPVAPEEIIAGVTCWKFPAEICQGRYNDRNGSNACSLITLLTGYTWWLRKFSPPECRLNISSTIVDALCGCIELGNRVYDLCRHSLPSRYLSIQEAASVLEIWFDISVGNNFPVRLEDQHKLSTIGGQLQEAVASGDHSFAYLILNEKTSLFYITEGSVMYIDTHSHGPSGAVIVTAELQQLETFCKAVWDLEGNDGSTYGNVVFVHFRI